MQARITPNFPHDAQLTVEVQRGVIVLTLDDRDEIVSVRLDAAQAEALRAALAEAIVHALPAVEGATVRKLLPLLGLILFFGVGLVVGWCAAPVGVGSVWPVC